MSTPHTADETPAPPTAAELLNAAARWIEQRGWTTGQLYEQGTLAACALGALQLAGGTIFDRRDWQARRAAITEATAALAGIAEEWNGQPIDAPTAQEQVIAWNNSGVIDAADAVVWCQKAAAQLEEIVR